MRPRGVDVVTGAIGILAGVVMASTATHSDAATELANVEMSSLPVNPCPNIDPDSKFSGVTSPAQVAIYGSRSDIEYDTPGLCGSDARFSIAWAMVSGNNSNTNDPGWAQTGYGNFSSGAFPVHFGFWEWAQTVRTCGHGNCPVVNYWRNHPDGTTKTYNARYQSNDNHFHFYVNGNHFGETDWDPNNLWDPAWTSHYYGETKFVQSDVPGEPGDPVAFLNNEKLVVGADSQWHWRVFDQLLIHDSPPCRYRFEYLDLDNSNFRIWTQPLESLC